MRDDQSSKHSLTLIEQQTVINTPMNELQKTSQFHPNRLKNKEQKYDINQSNKKFYRRQQNFFKYLFVFLSILPIKLNFSIDQKKVKNIDLIMLLIALPIVQLLSSVS
jgi:hypothetical protein